MPHNTPTTQRRLFLLTVCIDAEMLRIEPGLVQAITERLEAEVEPTPDVKVKGGDFPGFTVEASSDEDVDDLGRLGANVLTSGLAWVEDQATAILDRLIFPPNEVPSAEARAGIATVLAQHAKLAGVL